MSKILNRRSQTIVKLYPLGNEVEILSILYVAFIDVIESSIYPFLKKKHVFWFSIMGRSIEV